jgi:hypothetical protein
MAQLGAIFLSSSQDNLIVLAVIGAIGGGYLFYRGFRLLQRKRLILNTPASKIRSASMGLVEVSGQATGPYLIKSPLKQTDCFYYHSLAWEWKQRGKDSDWVKVADEKLHVPFYIDDGTGALLVDPSGAEMDLHCDLHQEYNHSVFAQGPDMLPSVYSFLSRHGVDASRRIKVEEFCVRPQTFLFVLGTLSQNPGLDAANAAASAGGYGPEPFKSAGAAQARAASNSAVSQSGPAAASPEVVRLSGPTSALRTTEMSQQQKIAAALMKAGITNPAAWAVAGVNAESDVQVQEKPLAGSPGLPVDAPRPDTRNFDLHPPVVLMKGMHDPAFFISWRSQRDLVASMGWKSALMIWAGPALTLVSIYILFAHFGWL